MCCIYGVILCVTFFGLMGPGLANINLGRAAGVEVFDTLRRVPPIDPSSKKGKKIEDLQGKITFKDLFFYYPNSPDRPIFYNFNLTIEPGQSVALVGPSGSGKVRKNALNDVILSECCVLKFAVVLCSQRSHVFCCAFMIQIKEKLSSMTNIWSMLSM